MASATAINAFASVVHNAQPNTATGINLFASVVHDSSPSTAAGINLYASVVHNAQPTTATGINLLASVVHNSVQISGTVANITGTVGLEATWDATPLGISTGSASFQWSWQSVVSGSALANQSLPLPDNNATSPISMTNNEGLWHLDSTSSVATQIGSVGLVDSFGDGWQAGNSLAVSVNGTTVLSGITLAAGAGPEWYDYTALDGDNVIITFTPGAWASECSYILNSGSLGAGVDFYTSPLNPATPYPFTANGFSSGSVISTLDSSGQGNTGTLYGATQAAGKVGPHSLDFDGTTDQYVSVANDPSITITGSMSIAAWVNMALTGDGYQRILAKATGASGAGGYALYVHTDGQPRVAFGGTQTTGAPVGIITASAWHHLAGTWDGSTARVYVDGVVVDALTAGSGPGSSTADLHIGADPSFPGTRDFKGLIDEVAIWSRTLSASEIADVYFLQSGSAASGSGANVNLDDSFSFVPAVSGTYEINLEVGDLINGTISGSIYAYISAAGPGPTPFPCIEPATGDPQLILGRGLVINNYINLSAGRQRRTNQVPFRLGGKDRLGLRFSDTISTTSGSTPTYCTGS
tara:strand:- start:1121 stop:2869 length:1749 start_codon:yes stop_codon:yes gene_type:complete